MAETVLALGNQLEIWRVPLDDLREQDINARSMPKSMFERLTKTIAGDQRLESLPLCAIPADAPSDGPQRIEIISGHHRTRAAREAGLSEVYAIVDVSGLTRDQIRAKQLAHNSIEGTDDPQLIARIYESIRDVDRRLEAYIDPAALKAAIAKVPIPNINLGLEYRTALFVLLPFELDKFEAASKAVETHLAGDYAARYAADARLVERWQAAMHKTGLDYNIRNMGAILAQMADIVLQELDPDALASLNADDDILATDQARTPIRDIIKSANIPTAAATIIGEALDRLTREGHISARNRWQGLEYLAADYLASPSDDDALEARTIAPEASRNGTQ